MTQRTIVLDPDILSGRWRLDGTTLPIADIRAAYTADSRGSGNLIRFGDLSESELKAVLDFAFPAIRAARFEVRGGSLTVNCECGEDTRPIPISEHDPGIRCVCDREWSVRFQLETRTAAASERTPVT